MTLAVHTGIDFRAWMSDPAAMATAARVLEQLADKARAREAGEQ